MMITSSKILQLAIAFLLLVGCSCSDHQKRLRKTMRDSLEEAAIDGLRGRHNDGKRNLRVNDRLLAEEQSFWGRDLQDGSLSMPNDSPDDNPGDDEDSPNEDDSESPPVPNPTAAPISSPTSPAPPPTQGVVVPGPAPTRQRCNSGRTCTSSLQCNCGSCRKNCGQIVCVVGVCT